MHRSLLFAVFLTPSLATAQVHVNNLSRLRFNCVAVKGYLWAKPGKKLLALDSNADGSQMILSERAVRQPAPNLVLAPFLEYSERKYEIHVIENANGKLLISGSGHFWDTGMLAQGRAQLLLSPTKVDKATSASNAILSTYTSRLGPTETEDRMKCDFHWQGSNFSSR